MELRSTSDGAVEWKDPRKRQAEINKDAAVAGHSLFQLGPLGLRKLRHQTLHPEAFLPRHPIGPNPQAEEQGEIEGSSTETSILSLFCNLFRITNNRRSRNSGERSFDLPGPLTGRLT